jgi:predicted TIM-barrel fold metal-dependent hydrolase
VPVKYVIDWLGDDRLGFSADFPHGDSRSPKAAESSPTLPIAEESERKILWDGCAACHRLPT